MTLDFSYFHQLLNVDNCSEMNRTHLYMAKGATLTARWPMMDASSMTAGGACTPSLKLIKYARDARRILHAQSAIGGGKIVWANIHGLAMGLCYKLTTLTQTDQLERSIFPGDTAR